MSLRFILKLKFRYRFKIRLKFKFRLRFRFNLNLNLGSVVQRQDSNIHWIAIFSTLVKWAVDVYNLRLRFGIYKLKFLRSIVGYRSIVLQLFD